MVCLVDSPGEEAGEGHLNLRAAAEEVEGAEAYQRGRGGDQNDKYDDKRDWGGYSKEDSEGSCVRQKPRRQGTTGQ